MSLGSVLVLLALVLTIAEALGKVPGWVPTLFLCVAMLAAWWRDGRSS